MKGIEGTFRLILVYVMLYKVAATFESVDDEMKAIEPSTVLWCGLLCCSR